MRSDHGHAPRSDFGAAEQLAADTAAGHALPVLASPVLLSSGELLHAFGEAEGWRFHGVDVFVDQRRPVVLGGPITFGVGALLTSRGNRRALADAERMAAPQWRPLGLMPVLATSQRLLVQRDGVWGSVWYSAIRQFLPAVDEGRLQLLFEDDPPYLLAGEWVPYLSVVMATVLAQGYGVQALASVLRSA